jgi:hypothetical protein
MTVATNLKQLYEIDDQQWLSETINLLKQKKFNELDLENLIEELELMGKRDKLSLESLLEQVIRHLLLYQYWLTEKDYNANHWEAEITSFRNQIEEYLTTNLYNYLKDNLAKVYRKALKYVTKKTNFKVNFPEDCPYTLEQLLDENYL